MSREANLSPTLKSLIELLIVIVTLLSQRLSLNSRNSSKPPSSDPNREKSSHAKDQRKPGGQPGHVGATLKRFEQADRIEHLRLDRGTLPRGSYRDGGYEARQVVDIDISRMVTEYRAEILINEAGEVFTAAFPEKVNRPIQYGDSVKAHAVYLSQFQLLPYNRIGEYFTDQLGIALSEGSVYSFNVEAAERVEASGAEAAIKQQLCEAEVVHADETRINIDSKGHWLHVASNEHWTWFAVHAKRGYEAMEAVGILPGFTGILCHDHWKPYYRYEGCVHALCNAHHLRELERAWQQDGQNWAKELQSLLKTINRAVKDAGGQLAPDEAAGYRQRYRAILAQGELECPAPDQGQRPPGQRGRLKRSKARNLLERLRDYEADTLRFMTQTVVPFTNNQGENDIRMTKVQQKISGCFRSLKGADMFCKIRSYISSSRKQGITATAALCSLFAGILPEPFVQCAE